MSVRDLLEGFHAAAGGRVVTYRRDSGLGS